MNNRGPGAGCTEALCAFTATFSQIEIFFQNKCLLKKTTTLIEVLNNHSFRHSTNIYITLNPVQETFQSATQVLTPPLTLLLLH